MSFLQIQADRIAHERDLRDIAAARKEYADMRAEASDAPGWDAARFDAACEALIARRRANGLGESVRDWGVAAAFALAEARGHS